MNRIPRRARDDYHAFAMPNGHPCHLCGYRETRKLLRREKRDGLPHTVHYVTCTRCSFVSLAQDVDELDAMNHQWMVAHPPTQTIQEYHTQELAETRAVMDSLRSTPAIDPATQSLLWDGRGRHLADVGCGAAGSLVAWAEHGWVAVGVEPGNDGAFASAELGLDVRVEPYTSATFAAASLGMIYSCHALEHFTRPFEALSNFGFHLEQSGLLYLETPDVHDADRPQLGYDHWSLFSSNTLRGALEAAGFALIAKIDRRDYGTHGVAVLARKERDAASPGAEFVPADAVRWQRDGYWALRLSLFHAYHGGRGRDLRTPRAPMKLARSVAKRLLRR